MNAVELIDAIESSGGRFVVDGDRVSIHPRSAAEPLAEQLCQHKLEILELLTQRPDLPAGVRLRRFEPKTPPIYLSDCSRVVDTRKFIGVTLKQLNNYLQGKSWIDGNKPLSFLLARLEAVGCMVELDDPRKDPEEVRRRAQ